MVTRRLRLVTVGGTFDSLHKGHRFLIREAFEVADRVLIGLTTDRFAKELHKPHPVDCFEKRRRELERFLKEQDLIHRAEVIPIDDPYGPTINSERIEGIVVSDETEPTAHEINRLRNTKGRRPLLIFCIKMILAEDGKPLSSTRVRRQEVDKHGHVID